MVPGTVKEGFFPSPEEDTVVISLDDDDDISIVDLSSDSEVDDVVMRPPISAAKLKEVEARIGKYIGYMDDLPSSPGNFYINYLLKSLTNVSF